MARYVEKVALVGASGEIGSYIAHALIQKGKHVTGLTRRSAGTKLPTGVTPVGVDYDDEASLVDTLKGHDYLIITLSFQAPQDTQDKLVRAAAKAGVPFVMPNAYSCSIYTTKIPEDVPAYDGIYKQVQALKTIGPTVIPVVCGFWYEYSLALGEATFGFDIRNRKVTFIDDGKTPLSVSTWNQCGRAIANFLSFPIEGSSPSIKEWTDKTLYFSSFKLSQRDMLDSLNRVMKTSDKDWTFSYEPSKDRCKRGLDLMQTGDFMGIVLNLYARVFYPTGEAVFDEHQVNETLQLPKEDLDEATKRAVDMAESGWNPYAR